MKAILIEKALSSVDEMRVQTVPEPVLKKGEVLVDVAAAGLNFFDILQVGGKQRPFSLLGNPSFINIFLPLSGSNNKQVQEKYQIKPPYPYIPGAEVMNSHAAMSSIPILCYLSFCHFASLPRSN